MKTPHRIILSVAAAAGIFAATPTQARDYGFDDGYGYERGYSSSYRHHHHGACYDRTVAWAQSILQDLGYYRSCVDGIFGSGTRSALLRYQCDHGLPHTGCLDSRTVCMLRDE